VPGAERRSQPGIQAEPGSRSGIHEDLDRQLRARRRASGLGSGRKGEREASVGSGAMGYGELRTAEGVTRHGCRGTQTQLGCGQLLRVCDERKERGEHRRRDATQW